MADLHTAAQRLRDRLGALPALVRNWNTWPRAYRARAHFTDEASEQIETYVATAASPDVVAAVAEHLLALHAWSTFDDEEHANPLVEYADVAADLRATGRALAAAILRDTPDRGDGT